MSSNRHKTETASSQAGEQNRVCDALWKRPIRGAPGVSQVSQFNQGPAPRQQGHAIVGLEMEMFAYDARNFVPLGLPGSVFHPSELLKRISDHVQGSKLKVDPATGVVVGLSMPSGANFSLEPGGQVEFSSAPRHDTVSLVEDVVFGLNVLEEAAGDEVLFLSHGTNPIAPAAMPLLVPKERYQILRRYFLSEQGGRGVDMMQHTATVQPNIDIPGDDSDWEDAVRITFALTPAVQFLTRNSHYFQGKRSQFPSERQQIWKSTDHSRSGIPEGIVSAADVSCHYANWARQANVFLVRGLPLDEQPLFAELTFEDYLRKGYKGIMPTLQDWELHLATLFPELRLRGFLEIRNLDAQSFEHLLAGVMLWKGLLIDSSTRAHAWKLLKSDQFKPSSDLSLQRELLTLATETLRRMGDVLGVAALEAAALHWLISAPSEKLPVDALTYVKTHATMNPSSQFVASLKKAGLRWDNSQGHPGWGGSKR